MIITRTPLRVSFCGNGTDLPLITWTGRGQLSLNKYVYITVNRLSCYFRHRILLKYSQSELVDSVEEISHCIIREVMKMTGVVDSVGTSHPWLYLWHRPRLFKFLCRGTSSCFAHI